MVYVVLYRAGTCSWYVCSKLFKHGPDKPLATHVAEPASRNSERLTARPARKGFVISCGWTEPIGAGIGAVCVDRGRPVWRITMWTDAYKYKNKLTRENNKGKWSKGGIPPVYLSQMGV